MKTAQLKDMIRGWFVGDFEPNIFRTQGVEVAVQRYSAGDTEARHLHKISTEITVIIEGTVIMNGQTRHAGDIILLEPGESTDFQAVTDTINVVVKLPSAPQDKYLTDKI